MKNFILILALPLFMLSCTSTQEKLQQRSALDREINLLQVERNELNSKIKNLKISEDLMKEKIREFTYIKENRSPKYILKLKIYQTRFSLDIGQHIKGRMNAIELEIPVDKDYYEKISVGSKISESFRVGSLIMSGSFGDWNVKVIDKRTY